MRNFFAILLFLGDVITIAPSSPCAPSPPLLPRYGSGVISSRIRLASEGTSSFVGVTARAFVEILPGKQGLLHISEISWSRLENMEGVFSEGDTVRVKLTEIDKQGRFRLSRKVLMPKPEKEEAGSSEEK